MLGIASQADAYAALRALAAQRGSERERALFDFFELIPPQIEARDEAPALRSVSAQMVLFKHQRDAARKMRVMMGTNRTAISRARGLNVRSSVATPQRRSPMIIV